MILYGTVQTIQRYGLKTADQFSGPAAQIAKSVIDSETGKGLLEWGMKLFYFDGRKCIQLVNFASKFTLFLFDIKKKEMQDRERYVVTWSWKLGGPKVRNTNRKHSFQVKDRYLGICRAAGALGGASVVLFKEFIPNLILRLLCYFACFFSLCLLANWLLYLFLLYQNHRGTLEKYIESPDH